MTLTDKQLRFIEEYMKDYNATQAAIRAGYSERTASTSGYRNINNDELQAELQKQQDVLRTKLQRQFASDAKRAREVMFDIMDDEDSPPNVRYSAAKDLLDRAGYKPVEKQDVNTSGDIGIKVEWSE